MTPTSLRVRLPSCVFAFLLVVLPFLLDILGEVCGFFEDGAHLVPRVARLGKGRKGTHAAAAALSSVTVFLGRSSFTHLSFVIHGS